MIVKAKGGYKVISEHGGKNLGGPYKSKSQAAKRLRQVEYFKHQGALSKRSVRGSKPMSSKEVNKGYRKKEAPGLLAWRRKQGRGEIMKPETFEKIKRGAARRGAHNPEAVAGAAYWKTAEKKYSKASRRGSKHYSHGEMKAGKRVLSTMSPEMMQTGRFTPMMKNGGKMPKHSMVMQIRKSQNRRY